MMVKKQQLEPDMEQQTCSKLGKEYIKAVYCHPAYLTYIQSTSCEMPGWMYLQAGIKIDGRYIFNITKNVKGEMVVNYLVTDWEGKSINVPSFN